MMTEGQDDRLYFPATERNRAALATVLRDWVAPGLLLELASGSGEHAVHIAPDLHGAVWQPSDREDAHLRSIEAWRTHQQVESCVLAPLWIDVLEVDWSQVPLQAPPQTLLAVNLIHIAPIGVLDAVLEGSDMLLPEGGRLIFYGPFTENGAHTSDSNAAFDESLRARDPRWGVRGREDVTDRATQHGFKARLAVPMPANNQTLIFEKQSG